MYFFIDIPIHRLKNKSISGLPVAPTNKGRDSVCVIIDLLSPSSQPPIHHPDPLQPRLPSVKLCHELMVHSGRMLSLLRWKWTFYFVLSAMVIFMEKNNNINLNVIDRLEMCGLNNIVPSLLTNSVIHFVITPCEPMFCRVTWQSGPMQWVSSSSPNVVG